MSTQVQVIIEAILKDEGFKAAIKSVDGIDKSLRKTEQRLGTFEASAKRVGQAMSGAFAVGAIGAFAQNAIIEFAKIERGFNALGMVLDNIGIGGVENLQKAKDALYDLAHDGGDQVADTLPVLQKFVGITKDLNAAMEATRLASSIAESGILDVRGASEAVANIMQGRATEAAKSLGIELVNLNGEVKTNKELLQEVIGNYGTLGDKLEDTTDKLSEIQARWNEFKHTVAGFFVDAVLPVVDGIDKIGSSVVAMIVRVGQAAARALVGDFAGAEAAYKRYMERIDEIWGKGGEDAQTEFWNRAWAQQRLLEQADRKDQEKRRQEEVKAEAQHADEIAKAKVDAQKRMWAELDAVVKQIRAQQEAEFKALEEEIEKLASKADQDAEARERLAKDVARSVLRTAEEVAETEEERRAAELEMMEFDYQERIRYAQAIGADTTAITAEYEKRKFAIQRHWAQADIDMERARAAQKMAINVQAAQIAIGALQTLFGENKALSVASAIISTWEGANKALAMGPVGIPLAAAIVAAGLANVAKIISTDPGGDMTKGQGFDNPRNDRMAYLGGRRWADDFVREVGGGLRDGLASASPVSNAVTNNTTFGGASITIAPNAQVIDDRAARWLHRKLQVAARRDQGRFIR